MKTIDPARATPSSLLTTTRKSWTPPHVDRIDAGQAEVGTRASNDGAFSTS